MIARTMFCYDIISYFCSMDIAEIFINKRKTGTPKKIAHISADNIIRMLKMVPLEQWESALMPCSTKA